MSCAAKFIPLRSRTRAQAHSERDTLAMLSHPLVTGLLDQFETRKTLILILELYPTSPQGRKGCGGTCGSGVPRPGLGGCQPSSHVPSVMLVTKHPGHSFSCSSRSCGSGPGRAVNRIQDVPGPAPPVLHVASPVGRSTQTPGEGTLITLSPLGHSPVEGLWVSSVLTTAPSPQSGSPAPREGVGEVRVPQSHSAAAHWPQALCWGIPAPPTLLKPEHQPSQGSPPQTPDKTSHFCGFGGFQTTKLSLT